MSDWTEEDWKRMRAMVYHESMWGCRGTATFYPPVCWLPLDRKAAS